MRHLLWLACCAVLSTVPAVRLEPSPEPHAQQTFRSGVAAVSVDVLVMDGGRPVRGLTAEDFELRDSGVVQRIKSVALTDVPVSLMLALDTSASVEGPALSRLKQAANAALDTLQPGDRAALLTFSGAVTLQSDWGSASAVLRTAVSSLTAGGSTSLFDAAFTALALRDPEPGSRSLIIIFSDGLDTSSWLPAHAALDRTRRTDAVVYAAAVWKSPDYRLHFRSGIQLREVPPRSVFNGRSFIEDVAHLTGGKAIDADATRRLEDTFTDIVTEFRSRYLLTYAPEGVDASGWHPIEVRLNGKKGRITARRGYDR
jgi:VWFA-related protein